MEQNPDQKAGIAQHCNVPQNETALYQRFPGERLKRMRENPQNHEQDIRELSGYLYLVSPYYRRLVDYFFTVLKYNYTIRPVRLPVQKPIPDEFLADYYVVVNACEHYNLPREAAKAMKIAIRDGVFYGLCHESENFFYIKPFDPRYASVTAMEDGVYRFSVNLDYFTETAESLEGYGDDLKQAYLLYKGDEKQGIAGDPDRQWYVPQNGICLKADESDPLHSLPLFTGLLLSAFDMEDYKMLYKARAVNESCQVLSAKLETDDEGVPKMSFPTARQYYDQIAGSLPDSTGLLLSPFDLSDISLKHSRFTRLEESLKAEKDFWFSSHALSVNSDESIAFSILGQFERYFNKKIRNLNLTYGFQIKFTDQSAFNSDEKIGRLALAVQNGLPFQMDYAAALGATPSDLLGMGCLND